MDTTSGQGGGEGKAAGEAQQSKRPRVQKSVIAAIGLDICSEHYPVGSVLPTENDLCELYGVSRTVIRESLKVLAAKGLVYGRPRIGTVVCEKEEWNILDPQILEWMGPRIQDLDLLGCILETRRTVEPVAAELAAERATVQEIADLENAWARMRNAGRNTEAFTRADVQFHEILLKASHNQVFRQLSSIIHAALMYSLHRSNEAVDKRDEALAIHRELVEALRMRDGHTARACAHRMLDHAARDLAPAMRKRGQADTP
ncbi:FadR family transcriptional regulator [Rhizobium sp. ARZ01]|uniref:FadR/GntR family transcriptional regulator n=1 Tax=Rhizobium sp. ARZ01 TaxID=2769313 RepID=UPI00177A8375|nr:FadR/GntR family transcriptional regulator [Rhizobium sp. ARZ01]MBD9373534.1 FadR family transcriptional regulator [Rhizobium sp. ARZ01]